jgi:hypothetical protein
LTNSSGFPKTKTPAPIKIQAPLEKIKTLLQATQKLTTAEQSPEDLEEADNLAPSPTVKSNEISPNFLKELEEVGESTPHMTAQSK